MRRRLTLATAALAVVATAAPAHASTRQTAKDISVKKADVKGFQRVVAPGLTRGPVSLKNSCHRLTKLVPRGATLSSQTYERTVSASPDNTTIVVDELSISTVLLKDHATATTIFTGLRDADRRCPDQVVAADVEGIPFDVQARLGTSTAPRLHDAESGFVENTSFSGTATVNNVSAPVSGAQQTVVYERGRALTILTLIRLQVTQTADGKDLISLVYVSSKETSGTLNRLAKIAVSRLGKQTRS